MAWFRCTGNTGGSLKLRTASGAIASFETNLVAPLNSLKCEITASGGNGTPSTPIPIVGHSELNLVRCGANIWDEEWKIKLSAGVEYIASKNPIPVLPNTTYYIKTPTSTSIDAIDENDTYISFIGNRTNATFTTPADCHFIRIATPTSLYGNVYNNDVSINYPSTDTSYHAYNGTTYLVSFGQTVYGGEYDANSDKMSVTCGSVDLGTLTYQKTTVGTYEVFYADIPEKAQSTYGLCPIYKNEGHPRDYLSDNEIGTWNLGGNRNRIAIRDDSKSSLTPEQFKTAMEGAQFVYELATPIEIDVSELSVETLMGSNNIFHDCNGGTEVKYLYKEAG